MPRPWLHGRRIFALVATFFVLAISAPAWAHTTGTLRVAVADTDELPVPGASLELAGDTLIGGKQQRVTDANGGATFAELPPGAYRLMVSKAGFKTVALEGLLIRVNRTTNQEVTLESGASPSEVTIVGKQVIDTENTTTGMVLDRSFLQAIPAGRSYQDPVATVPGVQQADPGTTETYDDYGVNPFADAGRDRWSTFAIDVDTGSYTMTRRKLTEGYLPPAPAVRAEEFVNYLPYEYPRPSDGDPFAVSAELARSPWHDTWTLAIGVQGKKVDSERRKPVHLTFLVDTSGSMQSPDKIGLVKQSLEMLTDKLRDGDTVAIVAYAGSAGLVLPATPMSQKARIIAALEQLEAGGSTAMGAGIDLAYREAQSVYADGAVNRVIIASDGDANVGQTDHDELSKFISGYAKRGITLTTLGFGEGNYRDTTMEQLADDGDGNYFYIDSEREARRVLVDKMTSTLEVIAKDVKIQVEFDPRRVRKYRLIGYENRDVADKDFRNDQVDGGEIGAGHQVTALYEVEFEGEAGPIGAVHVRNKAPGPDSPAVERQYTLSPKPNELERSSAQFRMALAAGSFAEVLRASNYADDVSLAEVLHLAQGAVRVEYEEDAELVQLVQKAMALRGEKANP